MPIEREVQSDGGTWYLLRLHPYRTADDRIDGVVLTFVEIDQLKRSEAALRASEETYRAIVSQSVVGIAVAAQGGRLPFANCAFGAMLSYGEAELHELRLEDITHPDDHPNSAELLERMWREGSAFEVETRYRRRDGRDLWVHISVAPISEGDRPHAAVVVVLDITQRLAAESDLRALNTTLERRVAERTAELEASNERLSHSQRRFAQAFQVGPVAACITTLKDKRFLEVNDVFSELTGYAPAEVIGKSYRELGMWASAEDQETLQQAGAPNRSFRNLELRIRTKSGDLRDVVLSSEIIRLDGEEGYLKMFYDISERKRTEEQLFRAVQEVMADTNWFSHKILEQLATLKVGGAEPPATVDLSRRERQVLERLAQGLNNEAIGRELGLSVQTVRNHISTIYSKLGVHSRAEAVVWARERGIIGF